MVPELKLEGVTFRVYRGDALHAYGEATTAFLRRDTTELRADDLIATLPHGGEEVRVAAAHGTGLLSGQVFSASGGVTVTRGDDVARTPSARFEPSPTGGMVRGDEPVVVEGTGYRLEGPSFTLDPATGDVVVTGGAHLLAGLEDGR